MYGRPKVFDHNIVAVNCVKNEQNTIVYRDKYKKLHVIDLEECARNFEKEYQKGNGKCVGDRNITGGYFVFYTSGVSTIVVFKKHYIFNFSKRKIFEGSRNNRFIQFQKMLIQTEYTTYDLS